MSSFMLLSINLTPYFNSNFPQKGDVVASHYLRGADLKLFAFKVSAHSVTHTFCFSIILPNISSKASGLFYTNH